MGGGGKNIRFAIERRAVTKLSLLVSSGNLIIVCREWLCVVAVK